MTARGGVHGRVACGRRGALHGYADCGCTAGPARHLRAEAPSVWMSKRESLFVIGTDVYRLSKPWGQWLLPHVRPHPMFSQEVHMAEPLAPGTEAPTFSLPALPNRMMSLSDLRGRPVVLFFYPADWSPVCGDQVALYNE